MSKLRQLRFYTRLAVHSCTNTSSVFVLSYPRSGSSWLSRLVASAVGIPYGRDADFFKPQVIHLHRFICSRLIRRRTIYIVRDVRDALLSQAHAIRIALDDGRFSEQLLRRDYGISPAGLDANNIEFLQFCRAVNCPRSVSVNWVEHVRRSLKLNLAHVRYEDLSIEPESVLEDVLSKLQLQPTKCLATVVSEHHIDRERPQIQAVRTGGVEKWKNFSEAEWVGEVTRWANAELRILGYTTKGSPT